MRDWKTQQYKKDCKQLYDWSIEKLSYDRNLIHYEIKLSIFQKAFFRKGEGGKLRFNKKILWSSQSQSFLVTKKTFRNLTLKEHRNHGNTV